MPRLSPCAFNGFIANIGQRVTWRRAHTCPCFNPVSGASTPDCPICDATGRFYDPAIEGVIGIASQKVQKRWADFGRWETGDAVVVVPSDSPLYDMGQFDRVTMKNGSDRFSLGLTRGEDDALRFQPERISRVFWIVSGAIVDGGIPAIAADGALSWPAGQLAPPDGVQYTIEGTKFSEYMVYDNMPSDRNEHAGAALPKNVVLRKFDVFGRN